MKPSMIIVLQLVASCALVILLSSTCGAIHHGPMIKIKFGHGGGANAAAIISAGIAVKLLRELKKHHHKGFSMGEHSLDRSGGGYGHSMDGGYGNGMDDGYGHGMSGGYGHGIGEAYGHGIGGVHSFRSHDDHLNNYGYEPQAMPWTK